MNVISSIKGAYLSQSGVYYRVDVYNHGDCSGYLMSLSGKVHGASDSESNLSSTCWCNDEPSAFRIVRIS